MYDELVKRLRLCAEGFRCRGCEYEQVMGCRTKLNTEAADAIEELSKRIDRAIELYNRNVEKTAIYETLKGEGGMSVGLYIPNIEMPKSCDDCPHPTCTLWQSVNGGERNEKCPIVPVFPHGRLIDADALHKAIRTDIMGGLNYDYFIRNAPTILEAEEGE